MKFRKTRLTAAGCLLVIPIMATMSTASAASDGSKSPTMSAAAMNAAIDEFAGRIHAEYGYDLDKSSLEILADEHGYSIQKRGAAKSVRVTRAAAGANVSFSAPSNPRPPSRSGAITAGSGETLWAEPECQARLETDKAWIDRCFQWGTQSFSNETRWNYAFKIQGSCAMKAGTQTWFLYLNKCYTNVLLYSLDANMYWNAWEPQGNVDFGGCGSVNLGFTYAGVGAGMSVSSCDTMVPRKGAEPGDYGIAWVGSTDKPNSMRGYGALLGVGVDKDGYIKGTGSSGVELGYF